MIGHLFARYFQNCQRSPGRLFSLVFMVVAGVVAVAFHKSIQFVFNHTIAQFATLSTKSFLLGSLATMLHLPAGRLVAPAL